MRRITWRWPSVARPSTTFASATTLKDMPVYPDLLAMAAIAAEEFRVEAACGGRESRFGEDLEGFGECVRRFYAEVQQACARYQTDLDVEKVARVVLNRFHALATWTGYVAAEMSHRGAGSEVEVNPILEELVLGETWPVIVSALQELPSAAESASREELEEQVEEIALAIRDWLRQIGFVVEAGDEGTSFRILRPVQWMIPLDKIEEA